MLRLFVVLTLSGCRVRLQLVLVQITDYLDIIKDPMWRLIMHSISVPPS
eukprot:COSAG02_NODE_3053_length_7462_cov_3.529540_7_plen_48_part_01